MSSTAVKICLLGDRLNTFPSVPSSSGISLKFPFTCSSVYLRWTEMILKWVRLQILFPWLRMWLFFNRDPFSRISFCVKCCFILMWCSMKGSVSVSFCPTLRYSGCEGEYINQIKSIFKVIQLGRIHICPKI